MSGYLDDLAAKIRERVPPGDLPHEDSTALFRIYAVLALANGVNVTEADVHNAWVAWMLSREPDHPTLVPFDQLDRETAMSDRPFVSAIREALRDVQA